MCALSSRKCFEGEIEKYKQNYIQQNGMRRRRDA
jgi:hypothetical protein